MGGWGSGRKHRGRKQTVDESLSLDLNYIIRQGTRPRISTLNWTVGKENVGSITYVIDEGCGLPTLTLHYTFKGEDVRQFIPIIGEEQPYGGMRYWMLCPLMSDSGLDCRSRCSKLYSPPGAKYFGCRKCYDLSYNSCNRSHKFDTLYKDFLTKHPYIPRKQFNEEFSGNWYYKYFRTRRAARKWYAKIQSKS